MLWFLLGGCSPTGRHLCIDRVVAVLLLRCVRHTLGPAATACFGFDDGVLFVHMVCFLVCHGGDRLCATAGCHALPAFSCQVVWSPCFAFCRQSGCLESVVCFLPATTSAICYTSQLLSWRCLAPTTEQRSASTGSMHSLQPLSIL